MPVYMRGKSAMSTLIQTGSNGYLQRRRKVLRVHELDDDVRKGSRTEQAAESRRSDTTNRRTRSPGTSALSTFAP